MSQDVKNKAGSFCWNEITTPDAEGSQAFYGGMFGWEFTSMPMPNGSTYTFAKRPGDEEPTGGMVQITEDMGECPPHWMSYIMVENCAEAAAKAESLGATVMVPTTDVGMGTFSVIKDPQGAVFSLWEAKEES